MTERPMSELAFRLMALEFRLRDVVRPPERILRECGIRSGMSVLDFGCGPGSFSLAAARIVGPEGSVCAVDIHPLALKSVREAAASRGLTGVRTLRPPELHTLAVSSVDVALLFDVIHDLTEPDTALAEIRRLLRPDGALCVSDHHLKEEPLLRIVTSGGLFRTVARERHILRFGPAPAQEPPP